MVKAMRADGPDWAPVAGRRCAGPRPRSSKAGWRRMSTVGSATLKAATESTRAACRANSATSCRRCCTPGATDPPPCWAAVCAAPRDRSGHPRRLRAGPFHPQDRLGPAATAREPVPPATVSRVAGTLDAAVATPSPTAGRLSCSTAWYRRAESPPEPSGIRAGRLRPSPGRAQGDHRFPTCPRRKPAE